jgi:hypothetical protein
MAVVTTGDPRAIIGPVEDPAEKVENYIFVRKNRTCYLLIADKVILF